MQIYLAVSPGEEQEASRFTRDLAHLAYRIGPGSTLLRQNLLLQTRGGLLGVTDRNAPVIENGERLCDAVERECSRRGYAGVLLDFDQPPTPDRLAFAAALDRRLSRGPRRLFLPRSYHKAAPGAAALIGSAVSGGTFRDYLQESIQAHGGGAHLALDVERLRMDFALPAWTGTGTALSAGDLQALMEREQPPVFFSQDLCARYFTYGAAGNAHFVLFDDDDTLRQKLRLGGDAGVGAAFLLFSEVRDLLPRLFARRG